MEVSFSLKTAIELAQNGNKSAFEFVYKETFSYVWYRANTIMNYNHDATADLVQDAYVICYQRLSTLENIDSFYSWMNSIVYHLGMQYFRSQKRECLLEEEQWNYIENAFFIDKDNNPELTSEKDATKSIVKDLIKDLPELQKITLLAYYYDELKVEQIATVMDCPTSTVKSRLAYARNTLKNSIVAIEHAHGYRIHVITFPIMYYAFKELYIETKISDEIQRNIYQSLCLKLYSTSKDSSQNIDNGSCSLNDITSSFNYTASISSALDSVYRASASLGITSALTMSLTGALDMEPIGALGMIKTEFATFLTSLKTKFALASAATAIGSNDVMLVQNINVPIVSDYVYENIQTGELNLISTDILLTTTMVLDNINSMKKNNLNLKVSFSHNRNNEYIRENKFVWVQDFRQYMLN